MKTQILKETDALCTQLDLWDPNAAAYARQIVEALVPRVNAALPTGDLSFIFL